MTRLLRRTVRSGILPRGRDATEGVTFLGRPRICGVLGAFDTRAVSRLQHAVPGLRVVHAQADSLLLASTDLRPYQDEADVRAWIFSGHEPQPGAVWRDVALALDSPGMVVDRERVLLHTGVLGIVDLFVRRLDDATWFASRMEDLLAVDDTRLTIDWDAWACIVAINFPVGDATPFQQIRRLQGGETLVLDRRDGRARRERWDPPWVGMDAAPPDAGDPGEVAAAIRAAVRRIPPGPMAVAVSGGYDSRLLAVALRDAGRSFTLSTTQKDDGTDDMGIAAELAGLLDLPLRVVPAEPYGLGHAALDTLRRVEYMVPLHAWIWPLARELRRSGADAVDSVLAANVLKGRILESRRSVPGAGEWREDVWGSLLRQDPDGSVLAPQAVAWAFAAARRTWDASIARYAGDPNEAFLALLGTRTVRGVANQATWMFGPELLVHRPFIDPGFITAGLRAGRARKTAYGFYREVLAEFDPRIAALRTSHDDAGRIPDYGYVRADAAFRQWVADRATHVSRLPGLVDGSLPRYLRSGRTDPPPTGLRAWRAGRQRPWPKAIASRRMARVIKQSMVLVQLDAWLERYRDRLESIDTPWESTLDA